MSSSLDDLEPYEIFQNDLDEYLKSYENHLKNNGKKIIEKNSSVIHQFIEYICFIKSKSSFEEMVAEEITHDFIKFLNKESEKVISNSDAITTLQEYFLYIDLHHKKLHPGLLKWLKI